MSHERTEVALPGPIDIQGALRDVLDLVGADTDQCALGGGVAVGVHGHVRYTKDVDLACTSILTARITPLLSTRDPKPLRIGGVSFASTGGVRVDLIDRRVDYEPLFQRAVSEAQRLGPVIRVGDRTLAVVTVPYLIVMKLLAARPQDEADIDALLRTPNLDYAQVRDVAARELGLFAAEYLDRLARKARRTDVRPEYGPGDS